MAQAVPYMAPFVSSIVNPINRGIIPQKESENMSTLIKVILGFSKTAAIAVLARANAVYTGIKENPTDFPAPTVDMAVFKAEIDTLAVKVTAALDGGKKAIAERNRQVEVVIRILRQLGHYVETACKDDMPTFLKSGFEAASTGKGVSQSFSQFIRKITHSENRGEFLVTPAAVPGASSYELRWAAVGAGGTPGTWTSQHISTTRPPASVAGLTPGTTYAFQVRSLVDSRFSDWSDSVTRVCV
jgi:hypothetical protein